MAEGRTLGDPETVHYGLVPRTNRGIFAVNELPDLAERIQVALLNVLEERDIQVRGYPLRLPLDLLLVASANPEDYTNRGRIITPLKDRFGAEVRTHYPLALDRRDRADPPGGRGRLGRPTRARRCPSTCSRSSRGSPARCASRRRSTSAPASRPGSRSRPPRPSRRPPCAGPRSPARTPPVARVVRPARRSCPTLRGKVEFEVSEEGREDEVLDHLLRRAVAETFRARLGGADLSGLLDQFEDGGTSRPASWSRPPSCSRRIGAVPGLAKMLSRLGMDGARVARRGRRGASSSRSRACT